MMKRIFTPTLGLIVQLFLFSSFVLAQAMVAPSAPSQAAFDKLVDEYFDFYFQFHPTEGTQAGLHQYDAKLEDFSRAGMDAEVTALVQFHKIRICGKCGAPRLPSALRHLRRPGCRGTR